MPGYDCPPLDCPRSGHEDRPWVPGPAPFLPAPTAGFEPRTVLVCQLIAGLGIDIWHGPGAPAISSERLRSLHPSGRAATRDRHPSMPDQRFPEAPHGPSFASQTVPAGPNAHKSPELAPQHTATHIDAPLGRSPGSHRAPNRQGSVTVALDIRLPERPEPDENVRPRSSLLGSSAAWDEAADRSSGSRLQGGPNGLCSKCGRLRFGSSPIHLSKSSPAS
jgi:hypothetical protein